jgi:hypothetical protein
VTKSSIAAVMTTLYMDFRDEDWKVITQKPPLYEVAHVDDPVQESDECPNVVDAMVL